MTTKEINEGNKLIAEFMGGKLIDIYYDIPNLPLAVYNKDCLSYYSSWDWLMPVCIKLGMEFVNTNIVLTYKNVINEIRSLEVDI